MTEVMTFKMSHLKLVTGENYTEEAGSLHGWYKVPTLAQIEAWVFDSVADTPNGDPVEPDHPDSWLKLLGAC